MNKVYYPATLIQVSEHALGDIGGSLTLLLEMANTYGPYVSHQYLYFVSSPDKSRKKHYKYIKNTDILEVFVHHNLKKIRFFGILLFDFIYSFDLIRIFNKINQKNTIIFSHGNLLGALLLFWKKIFRSKIPIVVIDASSNPYSNIKNRFPSIEVTMELLVFSVFKCNRYLFCDTIVNIKKYIKLISILNIKYSIYYIGTNTEQFKPIKKISNDFIIIFPHRLDNIKRPEIALEIFQQFISKNKYKEIKLYIVGRGPNYNNLKKIVNINNLNQNVFFFNNINKDQIIDFYNSSDVFIGTSLKSNYGISIQEAMSCAKPVIIFKGEVNKDDFILVDNMKDGFIINNNDVSNFVNCLQLLYDNPKLKETMGVNARNKILKRRNFKNKIKKDLDLLNDLIKNN